MHFPAAVGKPDGRLRCNIHRNKPTAPDTIVIA